MKKSPTTASIVARYQKIASITVGAVVFLILVGGVVRTTGSGMGCPDWPKCFGQWVPPTDVSQLPANYQEIYKDHGYGSMQFSAFKTWVEYVNRLIGVLIGFLAIGTAWASWPLRKRLPRVTQLSILTLLLVIIQGGIGAYVVRTNLKTGMVTLHMAVALLTLLVLVSALLHTYRQELAAWGFDGRLETVPSGVLWLGVAALVIGCVQILLGTQVREEIDIVAGQLGEKGRRVWLENVGNVYVVHQRFYYVLTAILIFWGYRLRTWINEVPVVRYLAIGMIGILLAEIALGLSLHHLGMPKWAQPAHLVLATALLGIIFSLWQALGYIRMGQVKVPGSEPIAANTGKVSV